MNEEIIEKARQFVEWGRTRDPFRLARYAGATVHFEDLGELKGMYVCIKRNRFIVVNHKLEDCLQRIVCAHELGHDTWHRDMAKDKWRHEFMIYNMNQRPEYEANLFASEILLPDEEIISLIMDGFDVEQIAWSMESDVNLVALKVATLTQRGYRFRQFESRDNFLK